MAKRKQVEREHVAFLKTYFSKKLVEGDIGGLLNDDDSELATKELKAALQNEDIVALNTWFNTHLSTVGRKTIWTAFRNVGYRERNPRSNQELRKSLVDEVMSWAEDQGIDNLNDAVQALLEAQQ